MARAVEPRASHRSRGERFRARIRAAGLTRHVEVPGRISALFARYARGGRITVAGTLNDTPITATLVPVAGGGHRLYVNGGMRSAARVDVGDVVTVTLSATEVESLRPPPDFAQRLERPTGAKRAFAALAGPYRREMIRYIDDARTPAARARRIESAIDHLLGRTPVVPGPDRSRPLWTCPKCGNQFVNPGQFHACARHEIGELFQGKPEWVRELFDRFRRMVEECGPVKMLPYRNRIGFMVRVRFAGAVPCRKWLEIAFWLRRRIESPRFAKVEMLYPHVHLYRMRITDLDELDGELAGWIREAYAVGCQENPLIQDPAADTHRSATYNPR